MRLSRIQADYARGEFRRMSAKPVGKAAVMTVCAALALGGCAGSASSSKTTASGGIGAAAGGILGAVLGGGSDMGALGGAAFGAMAGFIAGSLFGTLLDDGDRAKQEDATRQTLSQGDAIRWNSDRNQGVHGYSQLVGNENAPPARTSPVKTASADSCRTVREVAYVDGKEYVEMTEYCRVAGSSGWTRKTA